MMRSAVVLSLVCLGAACGGSSSSPSAPTPPGGTTPTTTTLTGSVAGYATASHAFTPSQSGSLTATLTWTAAADLDLYVTAASCTGYPLDSCVILARSIASTGTREETTLSVTSGTALLLWVDSFTPATAASYTITAIVR
jgi:hypothetical protein